MRLWFLAVFEKTITVRVLQDKAVPGFSEEVTTAQLTNERWSRTGEITVHQDQPTADLNGQIIRHCKEEFGVPVDAMLINLVLLPGVFLPSDEELL